MKKDNNTKISKQRKIEVIFEIIEKFEVSNYEISKNTGISEAGLGSITNGSTKNPREVTVNSIYNYLTKKYHNEEKEKEKETSLPKSDLKPKVYGGSIPVRLVENKAKAGWSDGYYAEEYLKDMPVVIVEADENYKGNYMAFEVEGDSMEPDYIEGNVVICREVQRHLWQSKLHYKDWDFVIAHAKDGIYLKEIVHHDVEKGIITCRSLNPRYKDFKVDLREVAHLYNVVETRQQGRNKRWNRVRDFFDTE